ncbi:cytochrome P450 [Gordonia sp. TBRC 11910]|uniref:Cytochrome P450 n=1 Tax=Gordonia asplenii TaxID=2725283 RepID=A0A848L0T2_9ACTN|nr:cytochrome P450 [Gordonia asplenii]NMO04416.1 cytochrome P450 [Gordonia asplenii]
MSAPQQASVLEGLEFTLTAAAPNMVTGLFSRKEGAVKVASLLDVDRRGYDTIAGLVRKYGPAPFYVRVAGNNSVLVTDPSDIEFVLAGSPALFASNPKAKQQGMMVFQPDALTLSRSGDWEGRRAFAEAVLDTGKPLHRLAATFLDVARDEADQLADADEIAWPAINAAFQRLTRRVVLGERAARDTQLTDTLSTLMAQANGTPGKVGEEYPDLLHYLKRYTAEPESDCLAGLFAEAPQDVHGPLEGQIVHWLFAMGDTLPANLLRTLVVLATHNEIRAGIKAEIGAADLSSASDVVGLSELAGAIYEAMRLWPTTPMLGRVALGDVDFPSGVSVPADADILIHNIFNHRNADLVENADSFDPQRWVTGDAGSYWGFNFFSNGPQGCPGLHLSLFLGQAFLARLLSTRELVSKNADVRPTEPLPFGLNYFTATVGLRPA